MIIIYLYNVTYYVFWNLTYLKETHRPILRSQVNPSPSTWEFLIPLCSDTKKNNGLKRPYLP